MKKVLVVDDSASMRRIVSFTLEETGIEVITAGNGQEALDIVHASGAEGLSMVITDLHMPVMNGINLISTLRKSKGCKYIPIIVLTTEDQSANRTAGKEAGASGWIMKPFRPDQLVATVERFFK